MVRAARIVEPDCRTGGRLLWRRLAEKRSHGFRHAVRMREISQLPGQGNRLAAYPGKPPLEFVLSRRKDCSLVFRADQEDGPLDLSQFTPQVKRRHQRGP